MLSICTAFFGSSFYILLPVLTANNLQADSIIYGWLTASFALGALGGSLWLARNAQNTSRGKLTIVSRLLALIFLIYLGLNTHIIIASILLILIGALLVIDSSTTNSLFQTIIPSHHLGKIISIYIISSVGVARVGGFVIGYMADQTNISFSVSVSAFIGLIMCIIVILWIPQLRDLS